jgi:hypothetical protein
MKSSSQQKFLVVSYDDDQQQWFWDYLVTRTEEAAVNSVCKRRPYVIAADAASLSQVQGIVSALIHRSLGDIKQQFIWDTGPRKGRNDGKSGQV